MDLRLTRPSPLTHTRSSPESLAAWLLSRREYLTVAGSRSRKAMSAKAAASLASEGSPNSSEARMVRSRGRSSLASMASKVGLLAPPPETTNSRNFPRRDSTKRRKASAIERAVRAVAVATTSCFAALVRSVSRIAARTRGRILRVLRSSGGLRRKKWQAQDVGDNRIEHCARSCDPAVAIIGLAEKAIGDGVNHHVAGAGVESRNLFRRTLPPGLPSGSRCRRCSARCGRCAGSR